MTDAELKAKLRGIELAVECKAFYEEFVKDLPDNITYVVDGISITTGNDSFFIKNKIAKIWAESRKIVTLKERKAV